MNFIETPELDKLDSAIKQVEDILDLLTWLNVEHRIALRTKSGGVIDPKTTTRLVLSYLGIDIEKVRKEKEAVISYLNSITGYLNKGGTYIDEGH